MTNVVRHSRASHCQIELGPRWLEIIDDGRGGSGGSGTGLTGLRERVRAVGGVLTAQRRTSGWRLRVEVPATSRPCAADATSATVLP